MQLRLGPEQQDAKTTDPENFDSMLAYCRRFYPVQLWPTSCHVTWEAREAPVTSLTGTGSRVRQCRVTALSNTAACVDILVRAIHVRVTAMAGTSCWREVTYISKVYWLITSNYFGNNSKIDDHPPICNGVVKYRGTEKIKPINDVMLPLNYNNDSNSNNSNNENKKQEEEENSSSLFFFFF